jgi:hypothetical protein
MSVKKHGTDTDEVGWPIDSFFCFLSPAIATLVSCDSEQTPLNVCSCYPFRYVQMDGSIETERKQFVIATLNYTQKLTELQDNKDSVLLLRVSLMLDYCISIFLNC